MKQSLNQVSLYKKIDDAKIEEAQIHFSPLELYYDNFDGNEANYIDISSLEDSDIQINEFDSMWSPHENNLNIKQKMFINNHKVLFDENGVACKGNSIGYAVHIHSRNSGFQKIVQIGDFKYNDENIELNFDFNFKPQSIRGIVNFDFFLFIKEINETKPFFANKVGMKLTKEDLNSFAIIVDGIGSSFPITEFSDKEGPLWKVNKNWTEASEDNFDSSQLSLMFNTKHPMFNKVNKGEGQLNKMLTGTITLQAMAMIINEVINIEHNNIEDEDSLLPGTILAVISYWIETFDINVTNMFTIQSSLFESMEREMLKE
ncbi:hypothetical protein ACFGC5_10610 [Staphylococcus xylosus]|uniref:hypothetical protein n=1 Tax=Staphylococcus xylosus TaxID=1288 RepID=UPI0035F5D719